MKTLFDDIIYAVKAMVIHSLEIIGAIRYFFIDYDYNPVYSEVDEQLFKTRLNHASVKINDIFVSEKFWWRESAKTRLVITVFPNKKINPVDWKKIIFIIKKDEFRRYENVHFKVNLSEICRGGRVILHLTPINLLSNKTAKKMFTVKEDIQAISVKLTTGRIKLLDEEGVSILDLILL